MKALVCLTVLLVCVQARKIPVVKPTTLPYFHITPKTNGVAHLRASKVNPSLVTYANALPSSCVEILLAGNHNGSGVYTIYPRQFFRVQPFEVYCDMDTDGGGWTVIQKRDSTLKIQENFNRLWADYRNGFGYLDEDFWLGLEKIFLLTVQDQVSLRVDLEDVTDKKVHGIYRTFEIANRDKKYAINVAEFVGLAGDPLWVGTPFTTKDDFSVSPHCLTHFSGGWWLNNNCPAGEKMNNPNGLSNQTAQSALTWLTWKADLKRIELKIRPSYFPSCANGGSHYYYT